MIIVSNTSPINYLILIGHINLLPELFGAIIIPQAVYSELSDASAPSPVQTWIATPPDWLKIQPVSQPSDAVQDLRNRPPSPQIWGELDLLPPRLGVGGAKRWYLRKS